MSLFARFQAIDENGKAQVVRKLIESGTPDFDFFYLVGLASLMATLGLLINSVTIVIGSMLIAPILYPILGSALGLVMSDYQVMSRSLYTLTKSFLATLALAVIGTLIFAYDKEITSEIMLRMEPSLLHFVVALVAGLAVSYSLAKPEWNETVPGIAISVAVLPPLAVVGIGLAWLDWEVVSGSLLLLGVNIVGIIFAAMVTFSLMNLHEKRKIADSTMKKEEERMEEEEQIIKEIDGKEQQLPNGVLKSEQHKV